MSFKRIIAALVIGIVMVAANLVIHESGHALTALNLGGRVTSIEFLGLQVYPKVFYGGFHGYLGQVAYNVGRFGTYGWITLMGSGSTWLVSIFFLFLIYALYFLKIRNFVLETVAFFGSLMFLDMLTYILGIRFTGLQEPLAAAKYLGWNQSLFVASAFTLGLIQLILLLMCLKKSGYWKYFLSVKDTL